MGTSTLAQSLLYRGLSRPTLFSVKLPSRFGFINSTIQKDFDGTLITQRNKDLSRLLDNKNFKSIGIKREVNDYVDLFCKQVTIPEGRLDVVQANGHENMGITRETAQNFIYGKPLTMTFIENSDFLVYKAMREWIERTGVDRTINQTRTRTIRMEYYQSYIGDIDIVKYELPNQLKIDEAIAGGLLNTTGYKTPIRWRFYNAYPIVVGSLALASDATDSTLEFEVQFTYESYSVLESDI